MSRQHPGKPPIDCLLYRGEDGELLGVLNHYPADYPPLERAGNFLVLVKPSARRRGIATLLLDELDTRYGLKAEQQAYSAPGRALVAALAAVARRDRRPGAGVARRRRCAVGSDQPPPDGRVT